MAGLVEGGEAVAVAAHDEAELGVEDEQDLAEFGHALVAALPGVEGFDGIHEGVEGGGFAARAGPARGA